MPGVLVLGGLGYIGSHVVAELLRAEEKVVIVDNLSKGHEESMVGKDVIIERGDVRDVEFLDKVFATHQPDTVMHFCAWIEVGESVTDPLKYYDNNLIGVIRLLQTMQKHSCKRIVFSSTAAIFGQPKRVPIEEDDDQFPTNPYGQTKLDTEHLLQSCDTAYGIKSVCLRYFNACGAHESGTMGEDHSPESHLIPIILQVAQGKRQQVSIFGEDYDTEDGTCIRDYVHVTDLADAHVKAIQYLRRTNSSNRFNLGSGQGYSVKEIIAAARKVTGHPIPAQVALRRAGDPARLIASSKKAEEVLGWKRRYISIEDIIATAWKWHSTHPSGYASHIH